MSEKICRRIVKSFYTTVFRLMSVFPASRPVAAGALTRAKHDTELMKGAEPLKAGKGYSADEIDAMLKKEFGI